MLVLAPPRQVKGAVEDALPRAVRDEAPAGARRRHRALLVRADRAPRRAATTELFALAERVRAARHARRRARSWPPAPGRAVARRRRRGGRSTRRAARSRRASCRGNGGPGPVATYHDLGSFQLLLSLQDDEALRLFCDSILAPIEDGEGAYGGELMRSLEAFIECNGQWERAARQLYCHRHTLRYRIRRVEELTGRSLDSARDRIDFWLALRGRELIGH